MVCCGRNPESDAAVNLIVAYRNGTVIVMDAPSQATRRSDSDEDNQTTLSADPWTLPKPKPTLSLSDISLSYNQTLLAGYSRQSECKEVTIWSSSYAFQDGDQFPAAYQVWTATKNSLLFLINDMPQVCSLTQFYSVDFSQSRNGLNKCVFYKRTIKVCVSCC